MTAAALPVLALIDGVLAGASRIAPAVNALFFSLLLVSATVALGLALVIMVFLVRYRRGSAAPRPPLRWAEWKFETAWIAATTVIFLGFFYAGARVYLRMAEVPAGAAEIAVIGRQWMWEVRHADGRRELAELHVPVNQPILLRLTSEDVIHSFAVPAFRLKQDAVPGRTVAAWFEATRPGRYPIYCDQYCGTQHAEMGGEVIVETPEDYAAWLAGGKEAAPAARGRALFIRYGCSGCHSGNSAVRAPRLEGLAGHPVPVEGGHLLIADESYLRDSILLPNQHVAAGYAPLMPSFQGVIPEGDLLDLIAYLQSLAGETPPANPPAP
ncbi:MAG TPA: cytochrome c oxidase subunit II [Opitutaceae bacterium]|nr:cytochrome c oxidase subunit II [Opitutaceae bacterium]